MMTIPESTAADIEREVQRALCASAELRASLPVDRARWLDAAASALEQHADELVDIAHRKTHLTVARLAGELRRTCLQLRHLGDVAVDGVYPGLDIRSSARMEAGSRLTHPRCRRQNRSTS